MIIYLIIGIIFALFLFWLVPKDMTISYFLCSFLFWPIVLILLVFILGFVLGEINKIMQETGMDFDEAAKNYMDNYEEKHYGTKRKDDDLNNL